MAFAFSGKKQMWLLGGLCQCFWTHICHLWVAFDLPRKSKWDSWGPLLMFLKSYLSSVSDICFFREKANLTPGASANVSGLVSIIYEWHLLFPEKANVTTGGALPVFLHIYWHLWEAFAFLEKANVALCLVVWTHICHRRVVYAVSGTPGIWNQPNFLNLGPLVQLEIFLYGICLHLLHLPHLLFIPTPVERHLQMCC